RCLSRSSAAARRNGAARSENPACRHSSKAWWAAWRASACSRASASGYSRRVWPVAGLTERSIASAFTRRGARHGLQPLELLGMAEGDEDVSTLEDHVGVRVEDHASRRLLDGHDDDAQLLAQAAVLHLGPGQDAARLDLRLLDLELAVVVAGGQ